MAHKHPGASEHAALDFLADLAQSTERRRFLKWGGISLAVAAIGCSSESAVAPATIATPGAPLRDPGFPTASLGTGDVGILNYAYALEQLEAAFYTQVVATPWTGITPAALVIMDDIRKHEVIHRDFLRDALGSVAPAARIPALEVTFTSVDFTNRMSVLTTARVFEDLGVSAYNGAGQLLSNVDYLVVAGKIVSVEARHAAVIRDLLEPRTAAFAGDDVVNAQGLDVARTPAQVLPLADPFILTNIDAAGLPSAPPIPA